MIAGGRRGSRWVWECGGGPGCGPRPEGCRALLVYVCMVCCICAYKSERLWLLTGVHVFVKIPHF